MKPVGIFYATKEGQTRRIADYIAEGFRARGWEADVMNVAANPRVALDSYAAAILAASVHAGRHESEMLGFVKRNRAALEALPTAFLSVTLSEAGAERADASPREHARFVADVLKVADSFFAASGWHPLQFKPVAGALLYSKYNFLVRFIMKRIARKAGGDTDTSHDYVYTDWTALDCFVDKWCADLALAA
jgi:menaquinone-dependent protoporphyrinogen oxidase